MHNVGWPSLAELSPILKESQDGRVLLLPDQLVARDAEAPVQLREDPLVVVLPSLRPREQFRQRFHLVGHLGRLCVGDRGGRVS